MGEGGRERGEEREEDTVGILVEITKKTLRLFCIFCREASIVARIGNNLYYG